MHQKSDVHFSAGLVISICVEDTEITLEYGLDFWGIIA